MGKVLDTQFMLLQSQVKEHIIKARAAQSGTTIPKHYTLTEATEDELNKGVYLDRSGKKLPIKPGTVVKVGNKYVLYTGQGIGYLTGNPNQPRIEETQ